jgi:Spy/CpxP family protein refolding chaperone
VKTITRFFIMIAAAAILLTPAVFAQNQNRSNQGPGQGQRGFNPEQMIDRRIESLDRELNLTPDQEKKIRAIMEKAFKTPPPRNGAPAQGGASSRRDRLNQDRNTSNPASQVNAEIKKVLTPEQAKKYDALPQPGRGGFGQGARGFSVDDRVKQISERLKLTSDQQKKIRAIYEKQGEEMRKMFEQMGQGGDREAMRETMQKQREKNEKEVEALLTADQKKAYAAWRQEMSQQFQRGGNGGQQSGGNRRQR